MQRITNQGVTLLYGNEGYVAASAEDVPRVLAEHGVAVLLNVLDDAECDAMRDGAWSTAEYLLTDAPKPLRRDDPTTWDATRQLQPHHGGLFQWHRWAHAQYVWDVRSNLKVIAPFKAIYGDDDLCCSFDGINFGTGFAEFYGHYKLHIDQDFTANNLGNFRCVQSWVTSEDVGVGDATFRFLSKSHVLHGAFARHFNLAGPSAKPDWFILSKDKVRTKYLKWYTDTHGCVDTCITVPRGSMVLWDSRTVHSGIEKLPGTNALRNLVYVCCMPRHRCLGAGMRTRHDIFDPTKEDMFLRTCSHWPDKMRPFGVYPPSRHLTRAELDAKYAFVRRLPAPVLDERAQRLAGLTGEGSVSDRKERDNANRNAGSKDAKLQPRRRRAPLLLPSTIESRLLRSVQAEQVPPPSTSKPAAP